MLASKSKSPASRYVSDRASLYGIYEISKVIGQPERLEVTLARVLHIMSSFLDMRHGLVALLGDEGNPELVVGLGWSESTAKRYFQQLPERAIGQIVVTQMPVVVEDMREDPLFEKWSFSDGGPEEGVISFIGVPIKDRGHVIGTLTVDRNGAERPPLHFDEDVRFLSMVANLIGQVVRMQRLIARDRERMFEEQRRIEKRLHSETPTAPTVREVALPPDTGIVGQSPALQAVLEKIQKVAPSQSTVLLRGESGTGKELFARALHRLSTRRDRPFVSVNCAALSESILESELFGHEKGAFTGAAANRKGRFELADGGTLFLDEIGEISPTFQAKLLRVLQEGEFERVGGSSTLRVDVRIVAATNRDLESAVAANQFRADLYYRITVVPIFIPPLRERTTDIPLLASEFLRRFNRENGSQLSFGERALDVLGACRFPGNVRELENCVRRTATFAQGQRIAAEDFACRHDDCMSSVLGHMTIGGHGGPELSTPPGVPLGVIAARRFSLPVVPSDAPGQFEPRGRDDPGSGRVAGGPRHAAPAAGDHGSERERLLDAMAAAGWVQAKAARLLGLTPRQIGYALRKHQIPIQKF
jgi:Nif-specific regulatory protein